MSRLDSIVSLLGDEADDLLGHTCTAIPKSRLHLPGPDFVDRIFANPPAGMRHAIAQGSKLRFAHPVMRRFINGISPQDLLGQREVQSLQMPTLMIWGREERVLPEANLDWFRTHLPDNGIIERWSDFGHIGFMERPAALARRIGLFVRELEGREAIIETVRRPRSRTLSGLDRAPAWA